MAQEVRLQGATYSNVPSVSLPDSRGTFHSFMDTSDANATASDILTGKTAYVNGVKITGTNSGGGGGGKSAQLYNGYDYVTTTSYTATDVTLTVEKSGTYDVAWVGWRNTTSGTSGTQLYINGSSYGSATTTFQGSYGQSVNLSGVALDAGDVLVVRARARSTSYRMYVANLVIVEK